MCLTVLTGFALLLIIVRFLYCAEFSSACALEIAVLGRSTLRAVFFLVPLFVIHATHSFNLVAIHSHSNLQVQQSSIYFLIKEEVYTLPRTSYNGAFFGLSYLSPLRFGNERIRKILVFQKHAKHGIILAEVTWEKHAEWSWPSTWNWPPVHNMSLEGPSAPFSWLKFLKERWGGGGGEVAWLMFGYRGATGGLKPWPFWGQK